MRTEYGVDAAFAMDEPAATTYGAAGSVPPHQKPRPRPPRPAKAPPPAKPPRPPNPPGLPPAPAALPPAPAVPVAPVHVQIGSELRQRQLIAP
jgi:hypothetical protein